MRTLFLFVLGCSQVSDPPRDGPSQATRAVWGDVYDGSDTTVPFLPDQNARYWRYAFERPAPGLTVRVRGDLSGVRYQGFDAYDDLARTSVGALRDVELDETGFTFHFSDRTDLDEPTLAPPSAVDQLALFLRLYDPEGLESEPQLPLVDLYDPDTDTSMEPPTRIEPPVVPQGLVDLFLAQMEIAQRDDRVDFYNLAPDGLYAADDNQYLTAQIVREPGEVVLLRFRPPTWSQHAGDPAEVRYWSLSQCDRHSYTFHTLADVDLAVAGETVELVIGDDDAELRAAAGARTYVPWATVDDELLLIYRNLATAPGFADALATVPLYDFDLPSEGQEATATLGDRAPSGIRCARDAFLLDGCGAW